MKLDIYFFVKEKIMTMYNTLNCLLTFGRLVVFDYFEFYKRSL